jgi:monofunctional glycosyltransferase
MLQFQKPITFKRIMYLLFWLVVGYGAFEYFTLPSASIINLRDSYPQMSALMRQRFDEDGTSIKYQYVPLEKISPWFVRAVIAVEDGAFYRHSGVDWNALENAYDRNQQSGRVRFGGSTITMQLAKNLFLSNDRSYLRKVKEAILTFRLEKQLSKKKILELYLNIIELGDGIFGAEAAARHYFNKSAAAMSREEAINLAAIISSPLKHTPFENSHFIGVRKSIILRKMGG